MKLYKVLIQTPNGVRSFYRDYTPYLPWWDEIGFCVRPGKWLPTITGILLPYTYGYHLTSRPELHGLPGDVVFEAEGNGQPEINDDDDQFVFSTIRLLKEIK